MTRAAPTEPGGPEPLWVAWGARSRPPISLLKRGDQLLERLQLATARRRRHHDDRPHAGRAPGLDALADVLGGAEQRDVAQPAIRHQLGAARVVAAGDGGADGEHLLLVARLDP